MIKEKLKTSEALNIVKLVYKDHPRDQENVVVIHRWSLGKFNSIGSIHMWTCELISRCSLYTGGP